MMPKKIDYPRSSLKMCLQVAKAVQDLGGSCSEELCAERLGKKESGAFSATISSAVKFGLIKKKSRQVSVTEQYRNYDLAYDEKEQKQALQKIFYNIPIFKALHDRFLGKKIPVDLLDKMLDREFEVDRKIASRVSKYFVEAAKLSGLLNEKNILMDHSVESIEEPSFENEPKDDIPSSPTKFNPNSVTAFTVKILGPGVNTSIEVRSTDDLGIVDSIISKVRKSLGDQVNG